MFPSRLTQLSDISLDGIWPELAIAVAVALLLVAGLTAAIYRLRSTDRPYGWQLGLLMATGLALSVASGWTTWDGMQNFTHEPLLALLITFGIQSVLLVVSWLIGESFANRPRLTIPGEETGQRAEHGFWWLAASFVGTVAGFIALVIVVDDWYAIGLLDSVPEAWRNTALKISAGALAVSLIFALCLTSGGRLFHSGIGLLRVAAQNASLWLMLIACMGASVFFSFDSLFSTIFPQSERARASDIRTQGKIGELVNDVKASATKRRQQLLSQYARSPEWSTYSKNVDQLIARSETLPSVLEAQASEKFRETQAALGALEVDLASAKAKLEALNTRRQGLRADASRIQATVEEINASQREAREKVPALEQEIATKTVEAEKELQGLGDSSRAGAGPVYRGLVQAQKKLEFELKLVTQRLAQLSEQLEASRSRQAKANAAVEEIDRQIAKQTVQVELAQKLLDRAQSKTETVAGSLSGAPLSERVRRLELARSEALRSPAAQTFDTAEQACSVLADDVASVQETNAQDPQLLCRMDDVRVAAAPALQMSKALTTLDANCTGEGKLPDAGGTEELIAFARQCIQMAGLPSDDMASFNARVGQIALNRDDKAHRFVVTINAFNDGNRLAYLALAIALAIDGLVFASGIFYAHTARSPLSDIPGTDGRRQSELEHILESALRPDPPEAAAAVLSAVRPHTRDEGDWVLQGFTHEIDTVGHSPATQAIISKLVGVAAAIGAAERSKTDPNCCLLRGEVVTYLSRHAYRSQGKQLHYEGLEALQQLLARVLSDDVRAGAATVLKYVQPIPRRGDFASAVTLTEIEDSSDLDVVRTAVNAAAVLGYVNIPDEKSTAQRYILHRDVFVVLADLAAGKKAVAGAEAESEKEDPESGEDGTGEPSTQPVQAASAADFESVDKPAQEPLLEAQTQPQPELEPQPEPTQDPLPVKQSVEPSRPAAPQTHVFAGQSSLRLVEEQSEKQGRSPAADNVSGKMIDASLEKTKDAKAHPAREEIPARTSPDIEVRTASAGSDAVDFGLDLSDQAFPDSLFESLEDDGTEPREEAQPKSRRKERADPVRSD